MDPLSAISLAGNIVAFLDVSTKLVKGAKDVYSSLSGTTEENQSREILVKEMQAFSSKLATNDSTDFVGADKQLCTLAEECRNVSAKLADLLGKIRAKNPKSKRESLWSSIKDKYYEKDMQALERRLDQCRAQLHVQLDYWTSQDIKSRTENILKHAETNSETLKVLQDNLLQIRKIVDVANLGATAQAEVRQIFNVRDTVYTVIAQRQVLKMLKFDDMDGRYEMIEEAHPRTFQWIFGDEDSSDVSSGSDFNDAVTEAGASPENNTSWSGSEFAQPKENTVDSSRKRRSISRDSDFTGSMSSIGDSDYNIGILEEPTYPTAEYETKTLAREKLLSWLAAGEGIFHISGKMGCGKSTLMKFLCNAHDTKIELRKWAGQRRLVLASVFFWGQGSRLQRSLPGLYRGFLYSVFQSCPDLIPQILPDIWEAALSAPWNTLTELAASSVDIPAAFARLTKLQSTDDTVCFCFFIDGLDEFQETTQVDYRDVTELLCSWTRNAPKRVKLCVSSREYNVFMNSFAPEQRLRLHELTRGDMEAFVRDKLKHVKSEKDREELTHAIVEKAHAIFVWLGLVTKFIREQIENDETVKRLKKELDTFPDELYSLYEHIIRSLSPTSRREASRTLRILETARASAYSEPAYNSVSISLFAYSFLQECNMDHTFSMRPNFELTGLANKTRNQRVEGTLRRLNGCLKGLIEVRGRSAILHYPHKSVADFVQSRTVQDWIRLNTGDFDAVDAISQILLAELRLRKHQDDDQMDWTKSNVIDRGEGMSFVVMRHAAKLDKPRYLYLLCFESALDEIRWDWLEADSRLTVGCHIPLTSRVYRLICEKSAPSGFGRSQIDLNTPFYYLVYLGYHDYPVWRILHDPAVTNTVTKATVLMYTALSVSYERDIEDISHPTVIETLLDHQILLPDTETVLCAGYGKTEATGLSIWQRYLAYIIVGHETSAPQIHGRIIEAFLRQSPDLNFSIALGPHPQKKEGSFNLTAVVRHGPQLSKVAVAGKASYIWHPFNYPSLRV